MRTRCSYRGYDISICDTVDGRYASVVHPPLERGGVPLGPFPSEEEARGAATSWIDEDVAEPRSHTIYSEGD